MRRGSGDIPLIPQALLKIYSLLYGLIAHLQAEKVLCHHAEVVKEFQCCTTDCIFCNVIGR